jgi:hypothetical protein
LIINTDKEKSTIKCNNNEKGLRTYNEIVKRHYRLGRNQEQKYKEFTVRNIRDTLMHLMNRDYELLEALYEDDAINSNFYNILKKDILCLYASSYYEFAGHKFFMSKLPKHHPDYTHLNNKELEYLDSTLTRIFCGFNFGQPENSEPIPRTFQLNPELTNGTISLHYIPLLWDYIHYKGYYIPQRNNAFPIDKINNDFHQYNLNLYAKYLSKENFQLGVGSYFFSWFHKKNIADGLVKPYASFKNYYPDNPFIEPVDSLAKDFKKLNSLSTDSFPKGIKFIQESDTINHFRSLLKKFKGQCTLIFGLHGVDRVWMNCPIIKSYINF